jgi:hypothetical protein
MKLLLLTIVLFFSSYGAAQDTATISLPIKVGYKKWTKPETAGRFGIGMQKEFYVEFGLSAYSFYYNDRFYNSSNYYGAIEWSQPKNIYGFKIGYELNASVLALGLEMKYQVNNTNYDFVFTPKIGFGILGIINVFYGYNISTRGMPFPEIGHHQFSMIFNINKKMFSRNTSRANQSSPELPAP